MTKLYASELLEKLVSKRELKILEVIWNDEIEMDKKIEYLLKEDQ